MDTALQFDDLRAENKELKQTLSAQQGRQAKLKKQLQAVQSESQAQIEAQRQETAALKRQVQALLYAQNQQNNAPNPPDGCCVIL